MRRWTISRRDFLALSVAGVAACKRSPSPSPSVSVSASASTSPAPMPATKILPAPEARIVDAIAARILPPDDGPGARDVNALVFVDNQLAAGDLSPLAMGVIATARIVDGE